MNASVHEPGANLAPLMSTDELRTALAFVSDQYGRLAEGGSDVTSWVWEAIQGDFNPDRSTGQIAFDTAISMVPGVDQLCDIRDLIANCKEIEKDTSNSWAWVSLCLTLIGLFPVLGSLLKGVLKIFFLFIRRSGGDAVYKSVDEAMTWVITYLRKREVSRHWKALGGGDIFFALAEQTRRLSREIGVGSLNRAFSRGITLLSNLTTLARNIPVVGPRAEKTLHMVQNVHRIADDHLRKALQPVEQILDVITRRLELAHLYQHRGVMDVANVHFRGGLPEAQAVRLMREAKPSPSWLSRGEPGEAFEPLKANIHRPIEGYPQLNELQIESFTKAMKAVELKGPMRLYRIIGPGSMAGNQDWVTEEVFKQICAAADPKSAWRKHLAVWPDWNPNGQFVVYDLKHGETLKVWQGPASSQVKPKKAGLPDHYLEGGWEQVKFDASQLRNATGDAVGKAPDSMLYLRVNRESGASEVDRSMNYGRYKTLPAEEQRHYEGLREKINHPAISGPFDTGWGMTDFDVQLLDAKLGLPALPGQLTELKK